MVGAPDRVVLQINGCNGRRFSIVLVYKKQIISSVLHYLLLLFYNNYYYFVTFINIALLFSYGYKTHNNVFLVLNTTVIVQFRAQVNQHITF